MPKFEYQISAYSEVNPNKREVRLYKCHGGEISFEYLSPTTGGWRVITILETDGKVGHPVKDGGEVV